MIPSAIGFETPHTAVHRLARRFLESIQDLLVLAIGRTLVRLFQEIFVPALDFRVVISEVLFRGTDRPRAQTPPRQVR